MIKSKDARIPSIYYKGSYLDPHDVFHFLLKLECNIAVDVKPVPRKATVVAASAPLFICNPTLQLTKTGFRQSANYLANWETHVNGARASHIHNM